MLIACVRSRESFHCPPSYSHPWFPEQPRPQLYVVSVTCFWDQSVQSREKSGQDSTVEGAQSLELGPNFSFTHNFRLYICNVGIQLCLILCDPMDYIVHGILQARTLEWVAIPFSRWSSQPRDRTQVSCIVGEFFTSWATREAQEYWSGQLIPSPADLPDPEIELGSPTLQADSLPTELSGKPSVGIMLIPTSWDC